jgi:hypothetical protein
VTYEINKHVKDGQTSNSSQSSVVKQAKIRAVETVAFNEPLGAEFQ